MRGLCKLSLVGRGRVAYEVTALVSRVACSLNFLPSFAASVNHTSGTGVIEDDGGLAVL